MKNTIILFFIFSTINLFPQSPVTPNLCLVTVENDSLVSLKWKYSDTTQIDGFIVKRIIFGGSGVVNGTLNNIQILSNTQLTYIDNSVSYQTKANPYLRSETYSLNAFYIRNDTTFFSNLTNVQKTVFFNAKWDLCSQSANLKWNKYVGRDVLKYQLFYSFDNIFFFLLKEFSPTDTLYNTNTLQKNTKYFFKIQAIINSNLPCSADTSVSNICNLYTSSIEAPTDFMNQCVSVNDNDNLDISFFKNGGSGIKKIILLRNSVQISDFSGNKNFIKFTDNVDTKINSCYKFQALDSCGNIIKQSAEVCNIVLNVSQDNNQFALDFNTTLINEQLPDFYSILVDIGNGWIDLKNISNLKTIAIVNLYDIFTNNIDNSLTEIGFKIRAQKDTLKAYSNKVYLPLGAIISVPNAFSPTSNVEQDRFFTIKGEFISEFVIDIYTQNNEPVFHSNDINKSWNGYLNSLTIAPKGPYIYFINYKGNSGEKLNKKGIVNLIY